MPNLPFWSPSLPVTDPTPIVLPPGWYQDPSVPAQLRWWDNGWTTATYQEPAVEPRRPKVSPPVASAWATWLGLAGSLLLALVLAVAAVIVAVAAGADVSGTTDQVVEAVGLPTIVASSVGLWVGFASAFEFARRHSHLSWPAALGVARPWRLLGWGLAVGVVVRGVLLAIELVWPSVFEGGDDPLGGIIENGSTTAVVAVLLVACVGAPVFEELFFRGVMLPSLSVRLPVWASVVVQALVFTTLHVPQPAPALAGICVTGTVFGVLRVKTQSVLPGVVAHSVFNTTSMVLALVVLW
jgi:membrane protease YdiL (CAAX protease family)